MICVAQRAIREAGNWACAVDKWLTVVLLECSESRAAARETIAALIADEAITEFFLSVGAAQKTLLTLG